MTAVDLGWMIAEHEREFPDLRPNRLLTIYLDEVQLVDGWESLVHRLAATREIELFISGSSAKLLSREVATASRGRLLEVLVHPFSFREVLRHAGQEPTDPWARTSATDRAALDRALRDYLQTGGFPEAQGAEPRDRAKLLSGYVDTMVLRDVIERHNATNVVALRALQRHLLANPGSSFTVQKFYNALRSQGVPVGKDTIHEYLAHLQDAFLVRVLDMHSASERQRMSNPRKPYPKALDAVRCSRFVVAVHGHRDEKTAFVMVGGLDQELRQAIERSLSDAGFEIKPPTAGLCGSSPNNVCNGGLSGRGCQLELSRRLRDELMETPADLSRFAAAIRRATSSAVKHRNQDEA